MKKLFWMSVLAATTVASSANAGNLQIGNSAEPIHCSAWIGASQMSWTMEFDDGSSFAVVNEDDALADYGSSHITVKLTADGPALVVGRLTGRLVIATADGQTLGSGICIPDSRIVEQEPVEPTHPDSRIATLSRTTSGLVPSGLRM